MMTYNPISTPDPHLSAVTSALSSGRINAPEALAKVLAIMGSMTPWSPDTLDALMDDVLVDVIAAANLPDIDCDDDQSMEYWTRVADFSDPYGNGYKTDPFDL